MKFIRRDYTAFVGIPSTRAEIQDYMCSEIADMIVGSETGWEYDTRTPNKTAFISLPNGGGTSSYPQTRYPVLYLRNSVSGAKMAVTSIYMNIASNMSASDMVNRFDPVTYSVFQNLHSGNRAWHPCGIGIAMIPSGVSAEFPDSYSSETSFSDGILKFVCEYGGYESNTSASTCFSSMNGAMSRLNWSGSGTVVSYGLLVDNNSVFLFSGYNLGARGALHLIYGVGKIIGTLSYDSEQQMQTYAGIKFANIGVDTLTTALSSKPSNTQYSYYGWGPYNMGQLSYYIETFSQNGESRDARYCVIGEDLLASSITNSESPAFIRWQPGAVYTTTGDPFYADGDRFKGYLDTNLIRYAVATPGQLFNNGQFCCVADNLLMKWDPDAEDTINA